MAEQRIPNSFSDVVVFERVAFAITKYKSVVAGGLALILEGVVDQLGHFNVPVTAIGFRLLDFPVH